MTNCGNCAKVINDNYCSHCGQAAKLKRIDGKYIIHEIEHVLHFDKGIFFTIKELLIRPGENVREFILENRNRLVKPIIFIIVTSLMYSLTSHFFHFEDGYMNYTSPQENATAKIFKWIQGHYGYANIIMGIFIAFWLKLFFRKQQYNFFEIVILLCFVMGIGMLLFSFFALLQGILKVGLMEVGAVVGIFYCIWAIAQFFEGKWTSYLKSFAAYMLGYLSFSVGAIILGSVIDLLIKH